MMNPYLRKFSSLVCLSAVFALMGCVSSTTIRTTPEGAKLYADGEYLGKTPYTYEDKKFVGSATALELKKEGHKTEYFTITRDRKINVPAPIGGIFVLVPFLWVMDYKPSYNFEMEPESSDKKTSD